MRMKKVSEKKIENHFELQMKSVMMMMMRKKRYEKIEQLAHHLHC